MIVAAAQFAPVPGAIADNVETMAALIRSAGARVVVFPELAVTGYVPDMIRAEPNLWLTPQDPRLEPVRAACRAADAAAVVNAAVVTAAGRPAITSLVIGPDGQLLARYDKRHLYSPEDEIFEAGDRDGRFELDGMRFALATCYDNRFADLAERAKADGCHAYLASSVLDVANDSFEKVYPVRARDNRLYVVLANVTGTNQVGECRGCSGGWGPDGERIADAGTQHTGYALVEIPS
ncbi:carbon-nitrogen hydrolase family protein [Nocardia sp. XZ_19_385]|uniref:carbon-nitrogen hydrolase family protein n=1 Tax=Nocardia sp. XZ_19_385 TaxID=2769488 RepID=UPI0018904B07|nr:carbon-nitrogen hydrolase family protein [Nocardia sp. XZ_19_385]